MEIEQTPGAVLNMSEQKHLAYCGVSRQARQYIIDESKRAFPDETGGMVVGKLDGDCVLVFYATGPGPKARHSPHMFRRDGDYSQKALDSIVIKSHGEYDYIGEWHSHPARYAPSVKDVAAMRWVADNSKYATAQPIMCLCIREPIDTWRLKLFVLDGHYLRQLEMRDCIAAAVIDEP